MEAVVTPVIIVLELTAVHVALAISWTVIDMAALVCVTAICICMYCMQKVYVLNVITYIRTLN